MAPSIWWIRRDLRLTDNQALHAAVYAGQPVIPVFTIDPVLLASPNIGEKRLAFLWDGLHALDASLRSVGSRLTVRTGAPDQVLAQIVSETGARSIFAEADITPYARRRDRALAEHLPIHYLPGLTVLPVGSVVKDNGEPYTVFTPFSRRWKDVAARHNLHPLAMPQHLSSPPTLHSDPIPSVSWQAYSAQITAGEDEAARRLAAFIDATEAPVFQYANLRDRPDLDGTSQLSPYLRFGMLSPRAVAREAHLALERAATAEARRSVELWLNEVIWREFYINILAAFPHVHLRNFVAKFDQIAWRNAPHDFEAWRNGQTGYPFVDAAMRQLQATGWIHNRARMVVASFLVKDLLIDWRQGERWFMQQLLDGALAANNGGWQWVAGTGTDAAPYFRIFNPISQGKKFDPEGRFVRRWIPELAQVPSAVIHEPWKMDVADQLRARCRIGQDYPAPMIDHSLAYQRALSAYRMASS